MRNIRAWDDELKEMLYSTTEQFDDSLLIRFNKHFETEKPVYLESTGLKDKNGKDIYEGDIAWDENYEEYCKVEFKEGCFRYTNGTVTQELFERCDQLEIVGNIYENTELLKEQTP